MDLQRRRNLRDYDERRIAHPALDAANIGAVQPAFERELFLREAESLPVSSHVPPDATPNIHAQEGNALRLIGLQPMSLICAAKVKPQQRLRGRRMKYTKAERVSLKDHPELTEQWVQDRIAEDPGILGLGDLVLFQRERVQPRAGRLDLLLQDVDESRRYEVELQLGASDESHIVRTLEYWDIERKRYPRFEHCAVLVAEDITSRFLNVIGLFNGAIPIVAIQMQAVKIDDKVSLIFSTVLNELERGLDPEEEEANAAPSNREYWEGIGSKTSLALVEQLLQMARKREPSVELKYNRFYIGLSRNGRVMNFIRFRPKEDRLVLEVKLPRTPEIEKLIVDAGLEKLSYRQSAGLHWIRLGADDLQQRVAVLQDLIDRAHAQWTKE